MTSSDLWVPGALREIPVDECLELAASLPVGRISYCTADGPVTLPLNFVLNGQEIMFRTTPHSQLGQHLHSGPQVCFEVDDFDDFFQSGWSVLLQGRAAVIKPTDLPLVGDFPTPWAGGERVLLARMHADTVTGRRIVGS